MSKQNRRVAWVVQAIYVHAQIRVCMYMCMSVFLQARSPVLHALPLPCSFRRLPRGPSSVIPAGKGLWQLRWLVPLPSPLGKIHAMWQGPTRQVRANPEMKGDF